MKELDEYTNEEKIKWFDETYNNALEQLVFIEKHRHEPKDCQQFTWEAVMELLGTDIWKRWNVADEE